MFDFGGIINEVDLFSLFSFSAKAYVATFAFMKLIFH